MARILYGVMGDARGHVSRALTIAQEMPEHEFLFVGGGRVHDLAGHGYHVEDLPMASTFYRNNRVDVTATAVNALGVFLGRKKHINRVAELIASFDPGLIISDYEYFTPPAASREGRPCVSLDHQHVLTHTRYEPPSEQRWSRFMTCGTIRTLYSNCSQFIIISFFQPPPKNPATTEVLPPLIRREVREQKPTEGDHVLVYQTSPTFQRLFPVLERVGSRFLIYGFGEQPRRNNLVFKAFSTVGFLDDLASCRYAITNGGHNVISEALFLGKPVISFPIAHAYEQFLNAFFLDRLGYGAYSTAPVPSEHFLIDFENRLETFKAAIAQRSFFGNDLVREKLNGFLS
jgi:uncharacterized protein (TIGR00661 family)